MLPPRPSTRPHWSRPSPGSEAGAIPEAPGRRGGDRAGERARGAGRERPGPGHHRLRPRQPQGARGGRDGWPRPRSASTDARLDVGAWSNGLALTAQMPEFGRQLVSEFDAPNPEAVRDLGAALHPLRLRRRGRGAARRLRRCAGRGPRPSRRPRARGGGARRHPGRAARGSRRLPRQPRPLAGARACRSGVPRRGELRRRPGRFRRPAPGAARAAGARVHRPAARGRSRAARRG